MPRPPPLGGAIDLGVPSTPHVLPEFDWNRVSDRINGGNSESNIGFSYPGFAFGGSMELMAVPKRKVLSLYLEHLPFPLLLTLCKDRICPH